jgi:hypothetical protein
MLSGLVAQPEASVATATANSVKVLLMDIPLGE